MTGCLDDQHLAAFVDGLLAGDERAEAARHVDGCSACLDRVAALAALADGAPRAVPAELLARATRPAPSWLRSAVPYGAVAASLLLAVALWSPHASTPAGPPAPASPAPADVRGRTSGPAAGVVVETPKDDDRLPPGFDVRWQGPGGVVFYEIQLTTSGGDLLWSGRVEGTERRVAIPAALPDGAPSYLWVTAHLPEGRRVSSSVIRVRGRAAK